MTKDQISDSLNELSDLDKLAHDCAVHPYFILDIASGEMTAIFSCKNDETAIRSFFLNMDQCPESIVKDAVLVDFTSKEIVFEGKSYIDKWKEQQVFFAKLKGASHAN